MHFDHHRARDGVATLYIQLHINATMCIVLVTQLNSTHFEVCASTSSSLRQFDCVSAKPGDRKSNIYGVAIGNNNNNAFMCKFAYSRQHSACVYDLGARILCVCVWLFKVMQIICAATSGHFNIIIHSMYLA